MNFESKTLLAGAMALVLAGSAASFGMVACSSSDDDASGDGGSSGSASNAGAAPTKPADAPTTDTSTRTFAVKSLQLGAENAWKKLGYNIDGKVSKAGDKDVCTAPADTISSPQQDGDNGIDNSFGANVLDKLLAIQPDVESLANTALTNGSFTIMIQTKGLAPTPPATATGITGQIFAGGKYDETADGGLGPNKPVFGNTATDWPVLPAILKDGTTIAGGSKIQLNDAFVKDGQFVSISDKVTLNLNFSGIDLALSINKAVISMKPNGTEATEGIISGYLVTSEVADALRKVGGNLSLSFCGSAVQSFVDNLTTSSDMLSDGTNTATGECNAISIGLGFTAAEIGNPTKVAPEPPPTNGDPCDAGSASTN